MADVRNDGCPKSLSLSTSRWLDNFQIRHGGSLGSSDDLIWE